MDRGTNPKCSGVATSVLCSAGLRVLPDKSFWRWFYGYLDLPAMPLSAVFALAEIVCCNIYMYTIYVSTPT